MIYPQRQLDPYEENEVKGTRMPDYTKLAKERDIYGELGWINNFNVKFSKNNDRMHPTYREFFDGPKNYNSQFNNSTMTNSEFFRQNAPRTSVARVSRPKRSDRSNSPNTSVGFKTFTKKRATSMTGGTEASQMGGSLYDTPFYLQKEKGNRHKVVEDVKTTMGQTTEIPFLRTQIEAMQLSKTHHGTFMGDYLGGATAARSQSMNRQRMQVHRMKRLARKE